VINDKNDGTDAYCISNTSRPLLCVGPKGGKGNRRTYLFVEALRKYQDDVKKADLIASYKKARPMYDGRLERTFVVLKDDYTAPVSGGNQEPLGNKRHLTPDQNENTAKRPLLK